jgi:exopolyphosphatase/guanosine-5'-triphosphate,3'-diphosphate pyrophosphatase
MNINKTLVTPTFYLRLFLFLLSFTCSTDVHAEIIRRAAFDFGSGKIKLQVADVDTENHLIVQSMYAEAIIILLSEDAANNPQGCFSEEIQKKALIATQNLKQKAIELGAAEFIGLATEAYRKAPNGQKLVDKYFSELNIPVKIISQSEEGKIGFLALIAETNLDPSQVISWDIGGGSFQVTYFDDEKNIQVYMAPFGRNTTKNAIIKFVKGGDPAIITSPNPMSVWEWENALKYLNEVLPQVPDSLILKLKMTDVQLIGISAHPEKLRDLKTYHSNDIIEILKERLNKNDNELAKIHKSPPSAISELALVYSIMHKLNVLSVNYIRTSSGSTSAILITEEYWNKAEISEGVAKFHLEPNPHL